MTASATAAKTNLIEEWWQEPGMGDQSMEDDHQPFWDDVINNVINVDLTGKKILDFGCNQGGMLRHLYKTQKFSAGVGVDLAQKSIAVANARKGDLPLNYHAMTDLSPLDRDFDYATSTAVIYLIEDIANHARQIYDRLKPGGVYFATHPDYVTNPRFRPILKTIDEFAAVKCALNDINAVVAGLEAPGFKVYLKRMTPQGYMTSPVSANSWYNIPPQDQIDLWYNHRYALRCVKPLNAKNDAARAD